MKTTKTDDLGTGATKRLSKNIEPQSHATTLSDAYPKNIVVQHMMPTTVSQFITSASPNDDPGENVLTSYLYRTLLAIFGFLIVSYKICAIWSEEDICTSRVGYLAHGVGMVLSALTAYTYFLRWKLGKRESTLPVAHKL